MADQIDINSDVGERPEALEDGSEELLINLISSANVACGGHAGDETTMSRVVSLVWNHGISLGAHPGFPDKASFGRAEMVISGPELERSLYEQLKLLGSLAKRLGVDLRHVKPHGALYNLAAKTPSVAETIAAGVLRYSRDLLLVGLAGSGMLEVWMDRGFRIAGEAFADRRYEPDGTLRSRTYSDALITEPAEAARQALQVVRENMVTAVDGSKIRVEAQTICVHSDTPNAVEIVREIRRKLAEKGIAVRPMGGKIL